MNTLHNYKLSENRMYYYIKTHLKNSEKTTCIPQKHPLNSVIASDAWRYMGYIRFAASNMLYNRIYTTAKPPVLSHRRLLGCLPNTRKN